MGSYYMAADKNFDTSSINAMKVGLMGPLSGIGDLFYWGTFCVVAAGIGIGIASTGNRSAPSYARSSTRD